MMSIVRKRLIQGILVLVPLGVTVLVLRSLFHVASGILAPALRRLYSGLPDPLIAGLAVLLLFCLIYLVGLLTSHLLGRRLIAVGEAVVQRVPLVATIYSATKQVVETLSLPNHKAFRSVVIVEFPRVGLYSLAFVTGSFRDRDGREFHRALVLTAPNPTSGFLVLVRADEAHETSLSVEEAVKMVMSGGIVAPESLSMPGGAAASTGCSELGSRVLDVG